MSGAVQIQQVLQKVQVQSGAPVMRVFSGAGIKGDQGIQGVQGAKGDQGNPAQNPNFAYQSTTLAAGAAATLSATGVYPNITLTFGIPKGDPGQNGTGLSNGNKGDVTVANVGTGSESWTVQTVGGKNVVTIDRIAAANGVAGLDANGKISPSINPTYNSAGVLIQPGLAGVVGDGVADDSAAIAVLQAAAPAGRPLIFTAGSYAISANLTFDHPIQFAGGKLAIATGVTVAINGGMHAPISQVFVCTGTGRVTFDHTRTFYGYAEWWGAKADGVTACLTAIHAARDALLAVALFPGDYLVNGTVKWNVAHRCLTGAGSKYASTAAEATRILCTDVTVPVLQHGPDAQPASINTFPVDIVVRDLYLSRNAPPSISSNCPGLLARWTLQGRIENVKSDNSMVGFRYNGTVHLKVRDSEAVRATAGSGAGTDYFVGHYVDGSGSIGAAGGNASLYLLKCSAGCNLAALQTATGSVGFKLDGAFTDVFIEDPETTQFYNGMQISGTDALGATYSNVDCRIVHPIMDQFTNAGIFVSDVAESGSIEIVEPYCGPGATARGSLWVNSSIGTVVFRGGQLVQGNSPGCQPIIILGGSKRVVVDKTIILEAGNTYPVMGTDGMTNCDIRPIVKNVSTTGAAVIQLSGTCAANVIEPQVSGKANAFTIGIQVLGTTDARNEYRMTGIDSGCIAGGASNKLTRNGVQVTATGLSGSNLVSGVMT